jgi:predicted nucleic acid-binding protein
VGVIVDSSVVIVAEHRRESAAWLGELIEIAVGDEEAALSSVGLTELVHGIYRAPTADIRKRRDSFLQELLLGFLVDPYTTEAAMIAGRIDGEQRERGIVVPFGDLLIGATALSLGFSVLTVNVRHFGLIPGLGVIRMPA